MTLILLIEYLVHVYMAPSTFVMIASAEKVCSTVCMYYKKTAATKEEMFQFLFGYK